MNKRYALDGLIALVVTIGVISPAGADNLFRGGAFANVASDHKGAAVGDVLTVVVYQSAEARNAAQNASQRRRSLDGELNTDVKGQNGEISLNGDFMGRGEVRRSESFVTQISVTITEALPNGDLLIAGDQLMRVNGEKTTIEIRGRVRPADITKDNQILSTRIADAEIKYDGEGFVSRNAKSGPIGWILGVLGLGG